MKENAEDTPLVAVVGRTNVGKSTLFNAVLGRRVAVVDDAPGVTRDRSYAVVTRFGRRFRMVDTGGVAGEEDPRLQALVRAQAEAAVAESDLVVAVFDGLEGVHPLDRDVAELVRRSGKPVLWVVNKCESPRTAASAVEFYSLGADEVVTVSAAHALGVRELGKRIAAEAGAAPAEEDDDGGVTGGPDGEGTHDPEGAEDPDEAGDGGAAPEEAGGPARPVRVAVIGRPNVGKSTLVNKLLGEDRLVTSDIAGTTRDAVDVTITRNGREFVFVDTAGLRKRAKVEGETAERYANLRTFRAVAGADVAVLVVDASLGGLSAQDQKIASVVHERGKGLVVVVNKWDAVEKDHTSVKAYTDTVRRALPFAPYAPVVFVSAVTGRRCPSVLSTVEEVYRSSRFRARTADVNRVLSAAFQRKPPPLHRGREVKLYFATQVSVAPPTFVLFLNYPGKPRQSYERYLKNRIRDEFRFVGTDIKIELRKRTERDDRRAAGAR